MSGFKEKPSGSVTLAIVGDHEITSHIEAVYGYDATRDAWQVAIKQHNPPQGQWSCTVTVLIRQVVGRYVLIDNGFAPMDDPVLTPAGRDSNSQKENDNG